jgi:tetratricopeptide (TPR) repeat protein
LKDLGDREASLKSAREAADIYRALADQRPEASHPDLAQPLGNMANLLSDLGDHETALYIAREAVDLQRALADQRPDAFRPDLARSLLVFADCLESANQTGALTATVEACQIYASLFGARPAAFAPQIAKTVNDYVARCKRARQEPDLQLLAPIYDLFERYSAPQENTQP